MIPGNASHTAMAGDPTITPGGKINPTLCMFRVSHFSLGEPIPLAYWDRIYTNKNKFLVWPLAHVEVMWLYGKVVQRRLGYVSFLKTFFQKWSSLQPSRGQGPSFPPGFSLKPLFYNTNFFWVSTYGLHIHYLKVVNITYGGYGLGNTKFQLFTW